MSKVIYGFTPESFDDRYREPEYHYGTEPNAFLVSQRHRLRPGMSALMPGDGEGRNGVWLAEQGLRVTSFDPSEFGVEKARQLAKARGVTIDAHRAGVETWEWGHDRWDVIGLFFIHLPAALRRQSHAAALAALKPGGIVVLETFSPRQIEMRKQGAAGGPKEIERLFTCEMLREDFAGARFLVLEETEAEFNGHAHYGRCGVVRMVAERVG
jgi:2-polyprenyl-3-methyl-5-hydroxy-6-metoxy-1,4-benzoquinol methylase